MKNFVNKLLIAVLAVAMTGAMAFAKGKSEKVIFSRDMVVNGTVVKKGTYKVTFDDQAKEMKIWDGKTEIAKSQVRVETSSSKPSSTKLTFSEQGSQNVLTSVTFAGSSESLVINKSGTETASPQ
jgi:hypothetical protein